MSVFLSLLKNYDWCGLIMPICVLADWHIKVQPFIIHNRWYNKVYSCDNLRSILKAWIPYFLPVLMKIFLRMLRSGLPTNSLMSLTSVCCYPLIKVVVVLLIILACFWKCCSSPTFLYYQLSENPYSIISRISIIV